MTPGCWRRSRPTRYTCCGATWPGTSPRRQRQAAAAGPVQELLPKVKLGLMKSWRRRSVLAAAWEGPQWQAMGLWRWTAAAMALLPLAGVLEEVAARWRRSGGLRSYWGRSATASPRQRPSRQSSGASRWTRQQEPRRRILALVVLQAEQQAGWRMEGTGQRSLRARRWRSATRLL